jgi:hypothetical protein
MSPAGDEEEHLNAVDPIVEDSRSDNEERSSSIPALAQDSVPNPVN